MSTQSKASKTSKTSKTSNERQKINPLRSVGGKIFITFFISIVSFTVIVGEISSRISENIITTKVSEAYQQTMIQSKDKLDMVYNRYSGTTMQVMVDATLMGTIVDFMHAVDGTYERYEAQRDMGEQLQTFVFSDSTIQNIHLFRTDGTHLFSVNDNFMESDASNAEWFQNAMEKNGQIEWLPASSQGYSQLGNPTFALTRMFNSSTPEDAFILFFEIHQRAIKQQIASIDMGEDGQKMVVSEDNVIMYSEHEDELGESFAIGLPSDLPTDESSVIEPYAATDEFGEERMIVYDRLNSTGWYVVGTVKIAALVEDAEQISQVTLILSAAAALLAAILGWFISRSISRPLKQMTELMHEGEQGKLYVRTDIRSKDEIGELGRSFNRMMEQISILAKQTSESAKKVLETASMLSEVSNQTAMSSKEISVATEQIAGGATTLASEAERGNDLTQVIGERMDSVVQSNIVMGSSANEVRLSSLQGTQHMQFVTSKTSETESITRSMVDRVTELKESTNSIRKILDLLTNVAKQTNILSLNATIEASRAGAAGKGFMVVADEIRKLADQSRESIEIVGQITEDVQTEIEDTVRVLSDAYPIFQEQTKSVKEADDIFRQVEGQMGGFIQHLDEVSSSIEQLEESQKVLSEAMGSVSAVSQESSATSEEVASLTIEQMKVSDELVNLSTQLDQLSRSLQEMLRKFEVEPGK